MTTSDRHPVVQCWLDGDNDAGGCIAELERCIAELTAAREADAKELQRLTASDWVEAAAEECVTTTRQGWSHSHWEMMFAQIITRHRDAAK